MKRGADTVKDDLKVSIRPASVDDARGILDVYAPFVTETVVSFEEEPPSIQEMAERVAQSHAWLVAAAPSRVYGYAYATPFHPRAAYRWSVEVSVYLAPDAHGRGVGKQLLRELLDRLGSLGFVNAFAGTTLPNPASVGLFEGFGFKQIALQEKAGFKLGAWHDVGWWQLRLQDPSVPPPRLEP